MEKEKMMQFTHEIDGFRDSLSPFAQPFAVGSSSSSTLYSDESIWGDYTLDLSFLSSDDQKFGLDVDGSQSILSRDLETNKEGLLLEDKEASSGSVTLNPNPLLPKLPEVLINSSDIAGDAKLDLPIANLTVNSERSSTVSDQDDSEEDSPCWKGMHSHKTLASGTKSRRSTDDLSGFHRLNPLAPQFIPSNSKKKLETDGKKCEDKSPPSSLKKSLSSTFPSSSGDYNLNDHPPEVELNDAARKTRILAQDADEIFGFVSQDSVSQFVGMSDSINDFQPSKRLDPLAPVFVPSSAKISPSVHEKQGAFETNAHSTSVHTSSDDKSLNKVMVKTRSGDIGRGIKIQYPDRAHESVSTSSYSPLFDKVGVTEYEKLGSSSNKSHGQRRLNPLAPQFSLADNKPKAYGYYENRAADDLSLVVNTTGLFPSNGYGNNTVVDVGLAQPPVDVERLLPNMSHGISSRISPKVGYTKSYAVEPRTTLSVKGNKDFEHPLPLHVVESAATSSGNVKSLSVPSPKMDVNKLLTTMHGLSELLTLADGLDSSDSLNAEELDLINSTVQNLNLYKAGNQSVARNSYDLKLLPNKSKLSIRDLELPTANNMTIDLDVKRKNKYSMVSREKVPDSRLYQYGATKDTSFGQVGAKSGYQQNHQGEEEINQHVLFYKSLWLKAEAERCLMVYETSLSNPNL